MNERYRQVAAWAAILSMPLAYGTLVLSFVGIGSDAQSFDQAVNQNAAIILPLLAQRPLLPWWSSILDFFGFYLLLLPLILYLHRWLRPRKPEWVDLFTVCGLGYVLLGAMGAAMLAFVFSQQATIYAQGGELERQIATAVFAVFGDAIQRGVWGMLDPILAGVWWLGIGWLLKEERRRLGWLTAALGIANLIGGFGEVVRLSPVAALGLGIYFLLAPLWAAWTGLELLRRPPQQK